MAHCFPTCGCSDLEGITNSDLDRFTDRIENVLNDENGRKLFMNFMITSKLSSGKKCLNLWVECDKVINSPAADSNEREIYKEFLCEVENLIEEAEKIQDLDFAIMEKLTITVDTEDKKEIITILKLLKNDISKAMRKEYSLFRKHFVKRKY